MQTIYVRANNLDLIAVCDFSHYSNRSNSWKCSAMYDGQSF